MSGKLKMLPGHQRLFLQTIKRPTSVRGDRNDADFALLFAELNSSVAESEQSVVAAATNVVAGTETGAALTDDDGTGAHSFAAEGFDSEKFGIAVATVAAAGLTFFMSHDNTSDFMLIVLITNHVL